jgi:hypothetical protein
LHLASTEFVRERQPAIRLATYDSRQATAAKAMGIGLYDLDGNAMWARWISHSGRCGTPRANRQ